MSPVLFTLAWRFLALALLMVGGANAVLPELHRQVVDVERWMTGSEFAALFAIASSAPGPNVMIVTLVGWHVAGLAGAVVTTVAVLLPSASLTLLAFAVWNRLRSAPWRNSATAGLTAVTVGLIGSSAWLLAAVTITDALTAALMLGSAFVTWRTKLSPLWAFAVAAAAGAIWLA